MIKLSLKTTLAILIVCLQVHITMAQTQNRWQQRVEYTMEIDMNVDNNQFDGKQKLVYYNNSPDTLKKVFFHLYFNAFQPGSMMDVRSRTIEDPDGRVGDRIFGLSPKEIGFQEIQSLKQDGKPLKYIVENTILEVELARPILPNKKTTFDMVFKGQVPLQVRRSGRDNSEGIRYTMTQWYPKICEYDYQGWHANPYVGREFHGVWGDFDVKIKIDSDYIIASTGILQNPLQIGYGYEKAGEKVKRPNGDKLEWHFKAENVHDFAWGADPEYAHDTKQVPDGPLLHFFYKKDANYASKWQEGQDYIVKAFQFMNKNFGKYPYKNFYVIQGGDGGMEYAMSTMITGNRSLGSFVGVSVHELIHSWFQGVLATNESLYAWMDEGFTTYATNLTMAELFGSGGSNPFRGNYGGYFAIVKRGKEEALSTHADHFITNTAYGTAAYSKGCVFLAQLRYVIGEKAVAEGMLRYFNTWKFKHPNVNDFIRIMEKTSGLELDWYKEYFVNTTYTIDYGIKSLKEENGKALLTLERVGQMPMPVEVLVTYNNGKKVLYYIPLTILRGEKSEFNSDYEVKTSPDWPWTYPNYQLMLDGKISDIKSIEIDPSQLMADINKENNLYPTSDEHTFKSE